MKYEIFVVFVAYYCAVVVVVVDNRSSWITFSTEKNNWLVESICLIIFDSCKSCNFKNSKTAVCK